MFVQDVPYAIHTDIVKGYINMLWATQPWNIKGAILCNASYCQHNVHTGLRVYLNAYGITIFFLCYIYNTHIMFCTDV